MPRISLIDAIISISDDGVFVTGDMFTLIFTNLFRTQFDDERAFPFSSMMISTQKMS